MKNYLHFKKLALGEATNNNKVLNSKIELTEFLPTTKYVIGMNLILLQDAFYMFQNSSVRFFITCDNLSYIAGIVVM